MKKYMTASLAIASLVFIANVSAMEAQCSAVVESVMGHQPATLVIKMAGKHVTACSLTESGKFNRVSPELCRSFQALVSQAKAVDKTITIQLDNADQSGCAGLKDWQNADVRWIRMD